MVSGMKETLADRYRRVRGRTEALAAPLCVEDQIIQSMPDASPVRWHRAHTTWFFETFVLEPHVLDHRSPHPANPGHPFPSHTARPAHRAYAHPSPPARQLAPRAEYRAFLAASR